MKICVCLELCDEHLDVFLQYQSDQWSVVPEFKGAERYCQQLACDKLVTQKLIRVMLPEQLI